VHPVKKNFLCASVAAAALLLVTPALAQTRTFNVPAEAAVKAIPNFARQAGVQIVAPADELEHIRTRRVSGNLDVRVALAQLLEGTNLEIATDTGSVISLRVREASKPAAEVAEEEPDTIVVTGFRGSLQKSLNLKKQAIVVRDSIVAEDIGKFPEANVAESLQRIPGVYLTRDQASNEGQRISIRGLGPQYAVTTLNGAQVHVTSSGNVGQSVRDFNYDVFASELFGRVDFYKTPLAELTEGGIGGVVDLQTPRPFDSAGRVVRYALNASYNTASKQVDPNGFLLLSNTWGNWGLLFGVAHSSSINMKSGWESTGGYNSHANSQLTAPALPGPFVFTLDFDDPRYNSGDLTRAEIENAYMPRFFRYYGAENRRERTGWVGSLQYRNDRLDVSLDLLGSHLKDERDEFTFGIPIRNTRTIAGTTAPGGYPGHNGLVPIDVSLDRDSNLLSGTFGNTSYLNSTVFADSDTKFLYASANARYQLSDRLTVSGQIANSEGKAVYTPNIINANLYGVTTTFSYDDPVYPSLTADTDLADPANYQDFGIQYDWNREIDREKSARFVVDYDYNLGNWTAHLKGGLAYVSTTKDKVKRNGTALGTAQINSIGAAGLRDQMVPYVPVSNLVIGDGFPQDWANFTRDFMEGTLDPVGKAMQVSADTSSTFVTEEQVRTVFLQSDFTGQLFDRELRVNVGVRQSATKTFIDNYTRDNTTNLFVPNHKEGKYSNTMPSISMAYNLRDDLIWRASWGKTVTRPALSIIAANTVIPDHFQPRATSGNANLLPETSTNYDTGLEWYFGRGGLISAGVFWKDIQDKATSVTTIVPFSSLGLPDTALAQNLWNPVTNTLDPNLPITLSTYFNTGELKLKGIELAYQQNFRFLPAPWDGFGALASYTQVDTDGYDFIATTGAVTEVNDIPKYSYSLTGYYEKGPFAARLSYNYKDQYVLLTNNTGNDLIRWWAGAGYLDGNVSYKLNSKLELRLDVLNIADERTNQFSEDVLGRYGDGKESRIDYAKFDGRTIKLGVRGKF